LFLHQFRFFHAFVDDKRVLFFADGAFRHKRGPLVLLFDVRGELGFAAVTAFVLSLHAPSTLAIGARLARFKELHFVLGVLVAVRAVHGNGFGDVHTEKNSCF